MTTPAVAQRLYHDPPNINWGRSISPEREWPGRRKDERDVASACGDGRDWFRYWHRLEKHREIWRLYDWHHKTLHTTDYYRGFEWNQRLIIGEYGVGKTTLAIARGLDRLQRGFPFFENGPGLVGWHLQGDEIFTAMGRIPPCSVLLFDEAHTALPGRLGGSTAVAACQALGANIRKVNCQWDIATAQHETVHHAIKGDCVEVVRPFKIKSAPRPKGVPTWDDPSNFIVAWDVWEEYPFTDPEVRRYGIDARPADYWAMLAGEPARNAFLMTDSFQRIDAGAAILANKEVIKEDLRALRGLAARDGRADPEQAVLEVVKALSMTDWEGIGFITPGQIAHVTGFSPTTVGRLVNQMFGVSKYRDKGYPAADLVRAYKEYQEP